MLLTSLSLGLRVLFECLCGSNHVAFIYMSHLSTCMTFFQSSLLLVEQVYNHQPGLLPPPLSSASSDVPIYTCSPVGVSCQGSTREQGRQLCSHSLYAAARKCSAILLSARRKTSSRRVHDPSSILFVFFSDSSSVSPALPI